MLLWHGGSGTLRTSRRHSFRLIARVMGKPHNPFSQTSSHGLFLPQHDLLQMNKGPGKSMQDPKSVLLIMWVNNHIYIFTPFSLKLSWLSVKNTYRNIPEWSFSKPRALKVSLQFYQMQQYCDYVTSLERGRDSSAKHMATAVYFITLLYCFEVKEGL